jgi:hypothetical protein
MNEGKERVGWCFFERVCGGMELIKIIEVELRKRRFKSEFKCLVRVSHVGGMW